jgi:hypothetical protein
MAVLANPMRVQKLEYNVTIAEGAARVTVVTGLLPVILQPNVLDANSATQSISVKALVDPTLTPGQFRKAVARASLSTIGASRRSSTHRLWLPDCPLKPGNDTNRVNFIGMRSSDKGIDASLDT